MATATTMNCTRRAMHVGFSIATVRPMAMTHASSYGRPVSQKEESAGALNAYIYLIMDAQ